MTEEFNIGWAHSLNDYSSVEVDYVHVLGLHENKTRLINPKLPLVNPTAASTTARAIAR